jgi:hypothetical protein
MALPDVENGQTDCPTIEDGSRLAPMHRFHDPSGALFATLPQWPRIKPKLAASIGRPCTIVIAKFELFV